jgi:hypothetical protein
LGRAGSLDTLPLDRYFSGVSVVTMRSEWKNPHAAFVGFKGGDNRVNHGQLDLGSFVFDANGIRWAVDLGPDDYNIPGYFGKQRWDYYRNRTEGHNALVINDKNQSTTATVAIIRFGSAAKHSWAVADLSEAYPDVTQYWRGMALVGRRELLVRDEIVANKPFAAVWNLHTKANIVIAEQRATLTQDDEKLFVEILEPPSARFSTLRVSTAPPQKPLKNVRRLSISVPDTETKLDLAVLLTWRTTDDRKTDRPTWFSSQLSKWPQPTELQHN